MSLVFEYHCSEVISVRWPCLWMKYLSYSLVFVLVVQLCYSSLPGLVHMNKL